MNYPPLIVKKFFTDAQLPVRVNPTDSGADVFVYRFEELFSETVVYEEPLTQDSIVLRPHDRVLVHTGITATVGPGYEIQVRPRSGNSLNKGFIVVNSPGTIDESYRGPFRVIIANIGIESQKITVGDKIAQIVVCPVILSEIIEVAELDETVRGSKGFGSSGA